MLRVCLVFTWLGGAACGASCLVFAVLGVCLFLSLIGQKRNTSINISTFTSTPCLSLNPPPAPPPSLLAPPCLLFLSLPRLIPRPACDPRLPLPHTSGMNSSLLAGLIQALIHLIYKLRIKS
ncbi:hypothetical protein E2C01_037354 [Portunus trituberculatus]|uniref:Uncharacterized protein n=1 Tax=Portunus trituberculatus TaxID=210409 RepID=A0A5B7FB75_PORTR|nr:hypothetical protein [Portunus trituberculatus]